MKWTQTLLVPKSITEWKWMEEELVKIINGYDPGGYSQTYVSIDWDTKRDFDSNNAKEMIVQTKRDFDKNLEYMRDKSETVYELVSTAHQMDLQHNFLSNWLIGFSTYDNPMIESEFIPIWNEDILQKYLEDHKEVGVWTVELYIHV